MVFNKLFVFLFIMIIFTVLSGCAASLQSYQPKSSEEVKIKELLLKWETTWNNSDVSGHLALWNDKAQIMYGGNRQIASKKDYTHILPERMKANPIIKLGAPGIKIVGDKAEVSVTFSLRDTQTATTFYLTKKNDLWSIMSWKY